jgi:hypothetical protein
VSFKLLVYRLPLSVDEYCGPQVDVTYELMIISMVMLMLILNLEFSSLIIVYIYMDNCPFGVALLSEIAILCVANFNYEAIVLAQVGVT